MIFVLILLVVKVAPLLRHGVGVTVLARMLVDRAPRAHVAPAEIAAADIYVVGLLHDAVVDRNGAALREDDFDGGFLGVGAQRLHHAAEHGVVFGQVFPEGFAMVEQYVTERSKNTRRKKLPFPYLD